MPTNIKKILRFIKRLIIAFTFLSILIFIIYDIILTVQMEQIAHSDNSSYINPSFCEDVQIHMVDVGQGDGFVITHKDKVIVVDCGIMLHPSRMKDYLEEIGVKRVNLLILTHPHQDHFGGIAKILCNFKVDKIITTEIPSKTDMTLIERFHLYKCNYIIAKFNLINRYSKVESFKSDDGKLKSLSIGDVKFKFLGPIKEYNDINNNSLVFKMTYKNTSVLFTGDIEKEAELDLVETYGDQLKVDILKLSHHGSHTSSTEEFLESTNPKYALISCEYANKLWHPHQEVASRLKEQGIILYRTDEAGNVVLTLDGNTVKSKSQECDYKSGSQLSEISQQ